VVRALNFTPPSAQPYGRHSSTRHHCLRARPKLLHTARQQQCHINQPAYQSQRSQCYVLGSSREALLLESGNKDTAFHVDGVVDGSCIILRFWNGFCCQEVDEDNTWRLQHFQRATGKAQGPGVSPDQPPRETMDVHSFFLVRAIVKASGDLQDMAYKHLGCKKSRFRLYR
jgi:hypothetical protein